jgi:nucleoside-diphosphate-sugar epimerase
MIVGVLGTTGMLGHNAAISLAELGHELVVLHRQGSNLKRIKDLVFDARVADIDNPGSLAEAFDGLDAVVHSAAYYPTLPRPLSDELDQSRRQMQGFLDAVKHAGLARAVYVGGAIAIPRRADGQPADETGVYSSTPPTGNAYVQCKWLMDKMAREAGQQGLPVSIAIPSMTFGEHDFAPSTGQLVVGIANGSLNKYVAGKRNVIAARDAGLGIARVLESGKPGERYLLTGHNSDMDEVIQLIAEAAGVPQPGRASLPLVRLISRVQSWRYKYLNGPPPTISATAIAVMAAGQHLDGSKAREELGFEAQIALPDAIKRCYQWLTQNEMIQPLPPLKKGD